MVSEANLTRIFGSVEPQFYIYAPPYLQVSAGIRALHYLCHSLNKFGFSAWIVPHASNDLVGYVSPWLDTPLITETIAQEHFNSGLAPIVVYPETVLGNPLNAQLVARWLLNFPGALGGSKEFSEKEHCFAFSKVIAESYGSDMPVLFVPPLDPREVEKHISLKPVSMHTGRPLIYAGKYRNFVGKPKLPSWANELRPLEIWREGQKKQSREAVLGLLRDAQALFIFENSTLITEATLLGTPVILIKSDFFSQLIAAEELGDYGCAWDDGPGSIEKAKQNLPEAAAAYERCIEQFEINLRNWALSMQAVAYESDYVQKVELPSRKEQGLNRLQIAKSILKSQGLLALVREVLAFARRLIAQK